MSKSRTTVPVPVEHISNQEGNVSAEKKLAVKGFETFPIYSPSELPQFTGPNRGFHKILEKDHPYIFIDACVAILPDADLANAHRHGVTAYGVSTLDPYATIDQALESIMYWHLVARKYDNLIVAQQVDDIDRAKREGKAALILASQGGDFIGRKLHRIEAFYRLGLRFMLPAYNATNLICGGALDRTDEGLSRFGELVVDECNRVGLVLDCTHIGWRASLDIIERSSQPVIFSHSNAKSVVDNPRNIDDEQIKACAAKGGVIGVVAWSVLLLKRGQTKQPDIDDFIDHIDHIAQLLGSTDHIGIGTDYFLGTYLGDWQDPWGWVDYFEEVNQHFKASSGSPLSSPKGFESYSDIVTVIKKLQQRGYSIDDISKILGQNFLRVFKQVWK